MLSRTAPLQAGTDTEIDLIEHQERGVIVEQPLDIPDINENHVQGRLGGLMEIGEHVEVRRLDSRGSKPPRG